MAMIEVSIEEHHQIQQLISDYAWSYDTRDFTTMSETFLPDGTLMIAGGTYQGRELIAHYVQSHVEEAHLDKMMQHHVAHAKIFNNDNVYTAYSYWMVAGQMITDNSAFVGALGWYEDILEKVDGRWFFKQRKLLDGMPNTFPWENK